ncbi:hypothetical protein, partial [Burkholderia multivorans]|uniref:hypothetical protein n=1 Tax=Burkholderia multivorans TaxID=87883 RepID=UPI001C61521B
RRKFVVLAHGSIFSKVGASSKPGAIQVAAMYDVEYKRQLARLQSIVKACPETEIVPLETVRRRTRRSNRKPGSAKDAPTSSSGEAS